MLTGGWTIPFQVSPPQHMGRANEVYQFKISLMRIRPAIWRRFLVPGTLRLSDLHHVIQTVFGWTDSHLHRFVIAGQCFGPPDELDRRILDETKVTISEVLAPEVVRFSYAYDFGDDWEHDVLAEKIIASNSGGERPLCLEGKRHRPPEDCGGPRGYAEFLRVIGNPRHPKHKAMHEWVGGSFDAEAFDLATVNRALAALRTLRTWVQ